MTGTSTGLEFTFEDHIYLNGSQETVALSENRTGYTFEFKIAFGLRKNSGQPMTYINDFIGEYLKVEIETAAALTSGSAVWTNVEYGNLMLRVDPEHEVFTDLTPGYVRDYEFTGGIQQVTLPPGTYFLQVWGAQRRK